MITVIICIAIIPIVALVTVEIEVRTALRNQKVALAAIQREGDAAFRRMLDNWIQEKGA